MTKMLLSLSAALFLAIGAGSSAPGKAGAANQDAAQPAAQVAATPPTTMKNPVKPTPESQAKAKKMYGYDCALCHGDSGNGKTDLAKDMQLTMDDMSDPKTLADKTDGELYDIITKGKGKMPAEDPARAKPDEVWNLIIYLRTLSKQHTQP